MRLSSLFNRLQAPPARFYSKNGEDYLLWRFFRKKRVGFFVDIGAFDGVFLSNTYLFEQLGWQGICMEPHPDIFPFCRTNRPGSLCLQRACIGNPALERVPFFKEEMGLLSTTIQDESKTIDIEHRYRKRGLDFPGIEKTIVQATTLNPIMDEFFPARREVDFISIDTEGNELDILKEIDFNKIAVRVLVVEANTDQAGEEIRDFLESTWGYHLARNLKVNMFFLKDSRDIEKIKNIQMTCTLEQQTHPLGLKYTHKKFLTPRTLPKNSLQKDSKKWHVNQN